MNHQVSKPLPATGIIRPKPLANDVLSIGISTLWRWVAQGTFPAPVKLSPGVTGFKVEDVRAWLEAK